MASKGYFNGKIIGNPSKVYDRLINWDISPQPYTNREDGDGFYLMKRKSYSPIWNNTGASVKDRWRVTDSTTVDNTGCDKDGECWKYYYLVNNDRTKYTVLKRECGSCSFLYVDDGDRCPCADDKFSEVFGRNCEDYSILGGVVGEIYNSSVFGYINVPDTISSGYQNNDGTQLDASPGQYVIINSIQDGSGSICGQIRQIDAVIPYEGDGPYSQTLQLTSPWDYINVDQNYGGAVVQLTCDVGYVPSYIGDGGITTIINGQVGDTVCDYSDGGCILSVESHNGQLTYLNDKGYNFFGGTGLNYSAILSTNTNNVGSDKIDSISFRNYLVFFGKKSVSAITYNQDGSDGFLYNLRDDIGVHNRGAATVFDNGLYFIGNDKRIYGASIVPDSNNSLGLEVEDITGSIQGHMKLIQDNDEVYLSSYGDRLYVFINGRDDDRNSRTNKSKILIYVKERGIWLEHHTCGVVITGQECGEFIGDNVYDYCGWEGDGVTGVNGQITYLGYEARAEAILYSNSNHGMTDENGLALDQFRRHSLENGIFLLGQGKYSDNTYVEMHKYDKIKLERRYSLDDENCVIEMWNDAWDCKEVKIPECLEDMINGKKCYNIENKCEGSCKNCEEEVESCGRCDEKRVFEDYCICYDNKGYSVSPFHKFKIEFQEGYADLYRVSFVIGYDRLETDTGFQDNNDVGYFGGMILKTMSEVDFEVCVDKFENGCCDPVKKCPINSCGN